MSDMILAVRITADGAQLVGQLSQAEAKALSLKGAMGQAATGTKQLASAADEVARAQRSAATTANDLAQAEANQARAAAEAAREHTRAEQAMTKSLARQREGYRQVGFQAQDFFTQLAGGTGFAQAFSQQSGQMVGALQLIGAEADGSKGKMAAFASFLGGPWGIALGVALPLVTMLVTKLFETGHASKEAEKATAELAHRQLDLANFFDLGTGAILEQNAALRQNAALKAEEKIDELRGARAARADDVRRVVSDSAGQLVGRTLPQMLLGMVGGDGVVDATYGRAPVNMDLVNLLRATRNDPAARAAGLRRIARSDSSNAGRAGQLGDALANDVLDQREIERLDRQVSSLDTGNLDSHLRSGGGRHRKTRRGPDPEVEARRQAAAARRKEAEAQSLADFGRSAAESIGRINDRWNEQPPLIDRARQDTAALEHVIADLERKRPPNFEETIASARAAEAAIQSGLLKPFNDMVQAGERQRELQLLTLQGREHEADVLSRVRRLEDQGVAVTAEQRAQIDGIVTAEERINLLLGKRDAIIGAYQQSIGDLRSSLEDLLSGGSAAEFGRSLMANARHLQGQLLTEQLFGSGLREIEQRIRRETGLEGAVDLLDQQARATSDHLDVVGAAAVRLADTFNGAADQMGNPGAGDPTFGATLDTSNARWMTNYNRAVSNGEDPNNPDIVVQASPRPAARPTITSMPVNDYFHEIARVLANPITTLLQQLDDTMGTRLAGRLGGVIEGGIAGYMQGGVVLGALGALKGANFGGLAGKGAEKAFSGAQTGLQVSQIGSMLGIKNSQTGAELGGAIGSFLPIPGGQIIGSIAGGLIGGLFKKKPSGAAVISSADSAAVTSGKLGDQLSGTASSVQSALAQIADRLGGTLGSFSTSIGKYGDYYRVSASGSASIGDKKYTDRNRSDILYDGKNEADAIMAAVRNAIADGGVAGLSAAVQKALGSSSDVDKAVAEALKVQQVEELLGGIGYSMQKQFATFETQAKDRLRIAEQYGFDVTAIETRNAEDRKKLIDQILTDRVGALQQLLSDMTIGNLFEGSAADRRTALLTEVAKAKADAEAGVDGAAQKLADLSRQLVETSRDAYGTAGPEYAADRTGAIASAEKVIALENERIKAAQDAALGTKAALDQNNVLTNESNDLLAQIAAGIANLAALGIGVSTGAGLSADTSRQVTL